MNKADERLMWFCALIISICLIGGLMQPYFEMRSFNKFSKTKATYWDAFSADLRIVPD